MAQSADTMPRPRTLLLGLALMAAEIVAGVVGGLVATLRSAPPATGTDTRPIAVVADVVIGAALLAIPLGVLRGRRRRRRWLEANILQAILGVAGLVAVAYSHTVAAALAALGWLTLSGAILVLLFTGREHVRDAGAQE